MGKISHWQSCKKKVRKKSKARLGKTIPRRRRRILKPLILKVLKNIKIKQKTSLLWRVLIKLRKARRWAKREFPRKWTNSKLITTKILLHSWPKIVSIWISVWPILKCSLDGLRRKKIRNFKNIITILCQTQTWSLDMFLSKEFRKTQNIIFPMSLKMLDMVTEFLMDNSQKDISIIFQFLSLNRGNLDMTQIFFNLVQMNLHKRTICYIYLAFHLLRVQYNQFASWTMFRRTFVWTSCTSWRLINPLRFSGSQWILRDRQSPTTTTLCTSRWICRQWPRKWQRTNTRISVSSMRI